MTASVRPLNAVGTAATMAFFAMCLQRSAGTCTNICGEGNRITKPNGVMLVTDKFGQVQKLVCQESQDLVTSGGAPVGWCSSLFNYAIEPCGCAKPNGTLLIAIFFHRPHQLLLFGHAIFADVTIRSETTLPWLSLWITKACLENSRALIYRSWSRTQQ
jgi:hypothetical protein